MRELELPALLSNSPLGFLAALGVLELTTPALQQPPRLSWRGPAAPAVLHTHQPLTHHDLAGILQDQLPQDPSKEPLKLAPGILSLPRHTAPGAPNDALRMPIDLALQRLRTHAHAERETGDPTARWFTALVNQLCITPPKDEGSKRKTTSPGPDETTWYTTTTPLFGRTGRMTLANNWAKAADHCRRDPTHLHGALTAWTRTDGYTGANLDYHSTGDAHLVSNGKPSQQGVPGATWLALHGFAAFRLTGDTKRPQATGWEQGPDGAALTWPIWHHPLTPTAITTLLEHPLIRKQTRDPAKLASLGITGIYAAPRISLNQSDGPLQPGQLTHP
ncbi:hypothetical protein ACF09H_13340 [Streptomyces sp. NPDC014983]|uniref:type I-G CRISPR-associated protein, Cas3-extension family n=1 Tax=Streptomyces sp. NPDC014983 TaxID=3364933 RepID=UPI0036FDAA80